MSEAGSRPARSAYLRCAPSLARGRRRAGRVELARSLRDDGAGPAAACRLHVDLLGFPGAGGGEEDRLHILAVDLGDEAHVGMQALDARRHRDVLLDQLAAHERCEEPGPGPGEEDAIATGRESRLRFHPAEELDDLLGLAGVVALVVLPA